MKHSRNLAITATLSTALLLGSSLAMAGKHGDGHQRGEYHRGDQSEACEQFRDGKLSERHQARVNQMEQRHEALAERLKLTDEQRNIWNQIHQERKNKCRKNAGKWQEKMQKRCETSETES